MLTDEEFAAVRDYLAAQAGLVFDESRRNGLAAVVADRLAGAGSPDVLSYLAGLAGEEGAAERQRLLDAVTVQETQFFRNAPQVEALRRRVLPDLLRRTAGRGRPLTIWSAGCSTGEEPYTLAMMLLELSPVLASPGKARILGTDVSAEALRAAARATYTGRTLEPVPPLVADRWLEAGPGSTYAVKDQVRRLVELRLHNLVTEPPPFAPGQVDLIVCRNVTIYFDRATTARLIGVFHDALADGGYLVLGHSETLWQVSDAFSLVPIDDAFVYRRTHDAQASARPRVLVAPPRPRARAAAGRAPARTPARPRALAAQPRSPVTRGAGELLATAQSALEDGRYDDAARAAAEAVGADPLLAAAYVVLGEARTRLGQDASAVDPLRKAVYLDPTLAPAHFLLAGALARLGQRPAAAVSYRAAAQALRAGGAGERHAAFLGGRSPRELAALCLRLAGQQATDEAAPAAASGGTP